LDAARPREHVEFLVLAYAVERQRGHLTRVVDREDEVRGVTGGPARIGQRALVELDDVGPALPGQVARERVTNDPRADDNGARAAGEAAHGHRYIRWTPVSGPGISGRSVAGSTAGM